MAPAQEKPQALRGARLSPGATLARATCVALLLGLPPVFELPGALSVAGDALAFSGIRAFVALGLLAGAAVSFRLPARVRRGSWFVGALATVVYGVLTCAALFGAFDVSANCAICLGFIAGALAAAGAFACGASWVCPPVGAGCPGESRAFFVARQFASALLSFGLLSSSIGREPIWTVARAAYAAGGFDAADPWHVLAYSFAGMVGPGPHLLARGAPALDFRALLLLIGWLGACLAASAPDGRKARAAGISGLALGVILARVLASLAPWLVEHGAAAGLAALAVGAALLAARARADADAKARAEDLLASKAHASAPDLSALSPREREAVEGRLAKKSSAEVARQMGVSASTVRNLQARAAKKLGVESLDELAVGEPLTAPRLDCAGTELEAEPRVPASFVLFLAISACAACDIAAQSGGWAASALVGEAMLTLALALAAAAVGGRRSTASLIPTTATCGVGLLGGTLIAAVAVGAPAPVSGVLFVAFALLLIAAMFIASRLGVMSHDRADMYTSAITLASCGAGIMAGSALTRPLLIGGELLALSGSVTGVAAVASLASLALGGIAVFGVISFAAVIRGLFAYRGLSRMRAQAPSLDERARALCRLNGLSETSADVAILLLDGLGGPQICEALHIAPGTLNSAKRETYRVFGVHSAAGLAARITEQLGTRTRR